MGHHVRQGDVPFKELNEARERGVKACTARGSSQRARRRPHHLLLLLIIIRGLRAARAFEGARVVWLQNRSAELVYSCRQPAKRFQVAEGPLHLVNNVVVARQQKELG